MRANDFIKKYGLDRAKKLLSITSKMNMSGLVFASLEDGDNLDFEVDELKRLIESHEIIKEMHGREKDFTDFIWDMSLERLEQAIADVESYQ
ncbi:MAG: hypothetical protein [Caudoviricetes sp.]|nr:MAG: hypothetical protein [Caudoviricetes sp.]